MSRTTSLSLGDHFDGFARQLVASGRYGSVTEVVKTALRDLESKLARQEALQRALEAAPLDDEPLTEEDREAIREARRDVAAGHTVLLSELRRELGL